MTDPAPTAGPSTGDGSTCPQCLRRGFLVGLLAARISNELADVDRRNPSALLALGDTELVAAVGGARREQASRFLAGFDATEAERRLGAQGVAAICRHSIAYPTRLLQLHDPPAVLFAKGRIGPGLAALSRATAVALVGSRQASTHGLEMARELGRGLAAAGLTVVSGLALGIDASAHVGALEAKGFPVAVLGCGPDVVYPRANRVLHEQIAAEGLLLSEFPPGQRPFRWTFPARNRIMAGLSEATIVIEAAENSGTLITSEFATDLGRLVGAVPGPAMWARSRGSNGLLRAGASVITSTADILDELFGAGLAPEAADEAAGEKEAVQPASERVPAIDTTARSVLAAIETGSGVEGACRATGLEAGEVRVVLAQLEDSGHLRRDVLGAYVRAAS